MQCSTFGSKCVIVRYVAIATPSTESGSVTQSTQPGAGSTVPFVVDVGSEAAVMPLTLELEPER